ncbi:MAG: hypothetical protein ACM3Q1_05905 [Bacteroidales bacterium]
MGGVVDAIFGGGDSGGSASGAASTSNNQVTVNPTTNVGITVDTKAIADALIKSGEGQALAQATTAKINAGAISAVVAAMGTATSAAQKQVSEAVTAFTEHVDKQTQLSYLAVAALAAGLIFVKRK